VVRQMATDVVRDGRAAADRAVARRRRLDVAEDALLEHARRIVAAFD